MFIPYIIFYLLRSNYRIHSSLCTRCGSKAQIVEEIGYDWFYSNNKCEACLEKKAMEPNAKKILKIIFFVWFCSSIFMLKNLVYSG